MLAFLIAFLIGSSVVSLGTPPAPVAEQLPESAFPEQLAEYFDLRRLGDKYFDEGLYYSARKTYEHAITILPDDYEDENIFERINILRLGIAYVKEYVEALNNGTVEEFLHPTPVDASDDGERPSCSNQQTDPETGEPISTCGTCANQSSDNTDSEDSSDEEN